jgi:hypothetical protein
LITHLTAATSTLAKLLSRLELDNIPDSRRYYRRLELDNINHSYPYNTTLAKLLSRLDLDKISDSCHRYRSQDVVTIYLTAVTTAGAKLWSRLDPENIPT